MKASLLVLMALAAAAVAQVKQISKLYNIFSHINLLKKLTICKFSYVLIPPH